MTHIVVIGGGQAGASLTAKLRAEGFEGDVTLISEEPVPPYQRPPLSKAYLLGEMEESRLYLRPESFYVDKNIALRLGEPVTAVDTDAQTVTVGGETLHYDELALVTGSRPRRLPAAIGGDLNCVYGVRTLADVDRMKHKFEPGRRVLIVGGGYIGLEAAAVAAKLGLKVTLVEMAERILSRVAAPETSDYFRALHHDHGVDIREGAGLERLLGGTDVTGARLTDGTEIDIDFAVVGVGIAPCTELAERAGLAVENGIRVDEYGRTSAPHVWAAGDCASFPRDGARLRLESVQNAIDQAEAVAKNMLGADQPYEPKPWFWSDQYDVKLQIAGLNTGYDRVVVRKGGDPKAASHWYYAGDRLIAVDAMNDGRAYMIGKRLIESGKSPNAETVADPDADLKSLLK
ncbi:NAD(P)/FAD-dependent oxidoreductase [Tranquillimonas alkanivorans]|uniref:3-phenylpropionate/trans-cinnamate dioxygenase ferredoxin reductase subunit n=1 Tax=Tranquillimonas alkanivorans TaxID=441119 RepID=A0A1I5PHJ7_9RHOB|nr:FAD-dependent oxidoreductase [Tranquillimonas alkanivorans]SFP33588.1 3-phenylpropionate/trans-cinnamate dioxygenase ferredoxin reductase subunit [Tranquillimonas alkanivorans]